MTAYAWSESTAVFQRDTQVTYFRFAYFEQVSVSGLVRFLFI